MTEPMIITGSATVETDLACEPGEASLCLAAYVAQHEAGAFKPIGTTLRTIVGGHEWTVPTPDEGTGHLALTSRPGASGGSTVAVTLRIDADSATLASRYAGSRTVLTQEAESAAREVLADVVDGIIVLTGLPSERPAVRVVDSAGLE